ALAANKAGVTAAADRAATATAATAATATAATAATATAATAATATAIAAGKPCFNYHVGLGPGPCSGACTPQEYAKQVERVTSFLSGQRRAFIFELEQGMAAAAAELDFEKAARIRDRIGIIRSLEDRQVVQLPSDFSADVIGFFWEESIAGVQVLSVREGLVLLANEFVLDKGQDIGESELVRGFLMRYYESASSIPTLVMLSALPEDSELIAGWLTRRLGSRHGAKVRLAVPKRGEKRELLDLAKRNAHHSLNRYKVRSRYDEERINNALLQLESALALPKPPLRIESFDISTIHGAYSVASMVVFSAGKPEKSQYRRFRIRLQTGEANDVAMMREVFQRRFAPERVQDQRFGTLPDLVIVDGGRPQLNVALQELKRLGLGLPCAGLAKSDEELFCEWSGAAPVVLPSGSAALYLVKRVRDEAHRFAISYHRELRGKSVRKSVLDDVFGLGPIRRAKLIRAFGSLKRLKAATLEEIRSVDDIPADVARAVFEQLHSDEQMKMRGV
ncbi:MAG: excinuclease ABC subunit UvrC, partial [Actinomycetia bacterium]|nr:excinuclease ABC subunit UvrC [Actinomycetes bacterium]